MGQSIDGGVNGENILAVLSSNQLREEACAFSLNTKITAKMVFLDLKGFQKELIKEVVKYLKDLPSGPLVALAKKARKVLA